MAVQNITYGDKSFINENVGIADINKVKDTDLNEIKSVVNNNATELGNATLVSTTEHVVGIYTNGKPIYAKTIEIASLPNATTRVVSHGASNVDEIWCDMSNSFIKWNTSAGNSPFNYIGGTSFNSMIELRAFTTTGFTIDTHSTNRSSLGAIVTINYTKTTD